MEAGEADARAALEPRRPGGRGATGVPAALRPPGARSASRGPRCARRLPSASACASSPCAPSGPAARSPRPGSSSTGASREEPPGCARPSTRSSPTGRSSASPSRTAARRCWSPPTPSSTCRAPTAAVLLSPFDNLLWDRPFARRVLGFDHLIEVYKPAPQRRFGYYVLPLLWGDRIVGARRPEVGQGGGGARRQGVPPRDRGPRVRRARRRLRPRARPPAPPGRARVRAPLTTLAREEVRRDPADVSGPRRRAETLRA